MLAITKSNAADGLPEEYPGANEFDNLPNVGYSISKFICDRLMDQATQRGVPIKSLRYPGIAGDSRAGHHTMQENYMMLRMISYLKLGVMPSLPLPLQVLPVDTCASVGVELFFNDAAPFDVYNCTNPNCPLEQSVASVGAELGYPIKVIDYTEFIKKLEEEGDLFLPLRNLYFNKETFAALSASPDLIKSFMLQLVLKKETDFFRSAKLQKFVPHIVEKMEISTDIIRRDLMYAKNAGVLKTFGIES
jgi:thioester reductase-like protein